jgi:hypothetical protein
MPVDDNVGGLIGRIDLQLTLHLSLDDAAARRRKPQKSRHRNLGPRRNPLARRLGGWTGFDRFELGSERRADSGLAVAVAKSAHHVFADRDERLNR